MADLKWDVPNTEEVELDAEELAELDRRIVEAKNGKYFTLEEVRALIPKWRSRYDSLKPR